MRIGELFYGLLYVIIVSTIEILAIESISSSFLRKRFIINPKIQKTTFDNQFELLPNINVSINHKIDFIII